MRAIKFKVWLPYNKIMMQPVDIITIQERQTSGVTIGQMKSWIWLQYSGMPDKNGTEIYEGDIVKDDFEYQVIFGAYEWEGSDHFGWYIQRLDNSCHGPLSIDDAKCLEVIGNRFPNPELLQQKEAAHV